MILDSSALVAVIRDEPAARSCIEEIAAASACRISAGTYVEAAIVADRARDPIVRRRFDDFLREARIEIAPVSEQQARIAREAYRDYGRGSGHPAKLNFGDCFSYALAKAVNEPLLFIGNDFGHTDVTPALASP